MAGLARLAKSITPRRIDAQLRGERETPEYAGRVRTLEMFAGSAILERRKRGPRGERMLHCVKCGTVLPEDATLCSNCGYPVNQAEDLTAAETEAINRKKYSAIPAVGYGHHVKMWFPVVLAILATAALYVGLRRKSDPSGIEIVKRHFVFYDDYSHGAWQHAPCQAPDHSSCVEVTYTVPVQACGPVTFSWRVFPSEDDLEYQGAMPRVNETRYAFYSFLVKETGALIPAQAYGKPVPEVCQYR